MRRPIAIELPLMLRAGLHLANTAELAHRQPDDHTLMEHLAKAIKVELTMDDKLAIRLFALWNCLLALGADEVGDWALDTGLQLQCADPSAAPVVVAVGATVYASGEVAFSVSFEGLDAPLWFDEQLDLSHLAAH